MKKLLCYVLSLLLLFLCFSGCRIQTPPTPVPPAAVQAEALSRRFYSLPPTPEKTYFSNVFSLSLINQIAFAYLYNNITPGTDVENYTLYLTDTASDETVTLFHIEMVRSVTYWLQNVVLSDDGNTVWLLEFDEGDVMYGGTIPSRSIVKAVDRANGALLHEWDLGALWNVYRAPSIKLNGNTAYVLMEYDTFAYGIACFDATDGTVSEMYTFDGIDTEPTLITLADGRVAAVHKESRTVVPFAAGTVTPEASLTPATDLTPEVYLNGGEGGQFFYIANGALYGDGTEPLLHLATQGVNVKSTDVVDIRVENGTYSLLLCERDELGKPLLGLYTLTPCTAEEAPKPLTLAGYQVDNGIHAAVKAYNRTHFDRTAVLEDYKQYDDDPNAIAPVFSQPVGVTKLNTELLAGKHCDLLVLNEFVSAAALTRQGALLDLYPLMDADSEMTRDTFVPTVLQKTEQNGKLYHLSSAFGIDTLLTNRTVVGDLPSLNVAAWNALAAAHPTATVSDSTETGLLYYAIRTAPYDFIAADRTSCTFDSPVFVQYLKTIEKQPNDDESWEMTVNGNYATRTTLLDGRFLTLRYNLRNFVIYQRLIAEYGEHLQFSGHLTESGAGHLMRFANTLGILSTSQNVPAAWEFLKLAIKENTLGMDEGEIESPAFPCDRASFEAQLAYYRDPQNFVDENGNPSATPDGFPLAALTDEDVTRLYTLIGEAKPLLETDRTLAEIIHTEATHYLGGECTAEEAAARIQERVHVYLSEQQ